MQTYSNVVSGPWEKQVLDRVTVHMRISFPRYNEPLPKQSEDRTPDQKARVLEQLVRDWTQGTHENVQQALTAIEKLVTDLAIQSKLDYWLNITETDTGTRPKPNKNPTSDYQQLRMLSEVREDALRDALKALLVLRQAARVATPHTLVTDERVPDDDELLELLDTVAVPTERQGREGTVHGR